MKNGVAEGTHNAKVLKHYMAKSTGKGTWGLRVQFVVGEPGNESLIWGTIWLTENTARMARKSLKAIGFDPDKSDIWDLNTNQLQLIGNECEIVVEAEEYENRVENKVKYINAIGGGGEQAPKEVCDRLNKALRDAKKKPKTKQPSDDLDKAMNEVP